MLLRSCKDATVSCHCMASHPVEARHDICDIPFEHTWFKILAGTGSGYSYRAESTMTFERYAIYWMPSPNSPLAAFARKWFGGEERFGLDAGLAERAVEAPKRYSFHGTIKAPFRLAPGMREDELAAELERFCSKRRRIVTAPLAVERFPHYLALCPSGKRAELEWLASDCITYFDRFRARLNGEDRARRKDGLPPREQAHFEQFGYPYIFNLFYFHISLAGPLETRELDSVAAALRPELGNIATKDFVFDSLCLCGDPGDGQIFRTISRFPLMR